MSQPSNPDKHDVNTEMFRFQCTHCSRSLKIAVHHIGKNINCPACQKKIKISANNTDKIPDQSSKHQSKEPEIYGVAEMPAPVVRHTANLVTHAGQAARQGLDDRDAIRDDDLRNAAKQKKALDDSKDSLFIPERPELPKYPFRERFWKCFTFASFNVRLIVATVLMLIAAPIASQLIIEYAPGIKQLAGGSPIGVMLYFGKLFFGGILALVAGSYLAKSCLAIIGETASGGDEINDWGEFSPWESIHALFLIGMTLGFCWLPMGIWQAVLHATQSDQTIPGYAMIGNLLLALFLFPIVLMRILEGFHQQSIFWSGTLLSLFLKPFQWFLFYLISLIFLIVPSVLLVVMFQTEKPMVISRCSYILAMTMPFCAFGYFRVYGRLAWIAEDVIRKRLTEAEEAEEKKSDTENSFNSVLEENEESPEEFTPAE